MVVYLVLVVTSLLVASTAAVLARQQNRGSVRWFYVGLVANVLAVAAILLSGKAGKRRIL